MTEQTTVERLVEKMAPKALEEFRRFFPEAETKSYIDGEGRGVIKVIENGYIVGLEFVETGTSWASDKRMWEYYVALVNKCRLVIYVPKEHADSARMRMLEFNNYWLNYYIVYSYDEELHIERMGRPKVMAVSPLRTPAMPLGGYL